MCISQGNGLSPSSVKFSVKEAPDTHPPSTRSWKRKECFRDLWQTHFRRMQHHFLTAVLFVLPFAVCFQGSLFIFTILHGLYSQVGK